MPLFQIYQFGLSKQISGLQEIDSIKVHFLYTETTIVAWVSLGVVKLKHV